eukprot:TRINITY_DN15205_c0_g1_i2.p1 TRINITY_DN15205_c0_g1~~TRINITY_DN15205_c0_g1_i2.p1  ORF type:complete len:332 (-),score=112.49 TRINITY_DN15205_c0_g1_i2:280-1275(-)
MNLTAGTQKKIPRDTTYMRKQFQQIDSLHGEVMAEVDKMNAMIKRGLQESQDDLLLAYRLEMQKVERDYQEISRKINDDEAGAKLEMKMGSIRQELNWFKAEVERLYKKFDEQQAMIGKMKAALEVEEGDRDFYQQQLVKSRKVNKNLEVQIKVFRRKYPELVAMHSEHKESPDNSLSLNELLKEEERRSPRFSVEDTKELKDFGEQSAVKKPEKLLVVQGENEELKKREEESIASINSLKKNVDRLAKASREARAQKVVDSMKESETKEFFLNCIDELRKEIMNKQTLNKIPRLRRAATQGGKFRDYGHIGRDTNRPAEFQSAEKKYFAA